MITHYDLFAGIGGFSLALEEVFKGDAIRHIFCEWEAFPTAVLKQHWPDGEYWGDIADLVADTDKQRLEGGKPEKTMGQRGQSSRKWSNEKQGWSIVTGGFPCQPFSHAGRRKGTADHRYQWPNMFEVIRNVAPEWVIAENVRGLVTWNEGMVLETVCSDLESEGYEVQPFVIPACATGAPHRRDRIWIIARRHADGERLPGFAEIDPAEAWQPSLGRTEGRHSPDWERDWREVALATCHDTVDDGIPRRMDGSTISSAKWRQESLKAYGNAIVPQVAMQIFKAIKETMKHENREVI